MYVSTTSMEPSILKSPVPYHTGNVIVTVPLPPTPMESIGTINPALLFQDI